MLQRSTSGAAQNPAQPCRFLPCLKYLEDIMEICSTGLGIPKLGKHRVLPFHTGTTGVRWANPLHQLGKKNTELPQ